MTPNSMGHSVSLSSILTAGSHLVGAVLAILLSIAQFGLVNALGRGIGPTLGADELVVRTGDGSAVVFVGAIRAIFVAIAVPPGGNTTVVFAPELPTVARREVWKKILLLLYVTRIGRLLK